MFLKRRCVTSLLINSALQTHVLVLLRICSRAVRSHDCVECEQHVPDLDEALRDLRESLAFFRRMHPDALAVSLPECCPAGNLNSRRVFMGKDMYRSSLSPENEDWLFRTYQLYVSSKRSNKCTPA